MKSDGDGALMPFYFFDWTPETIDYIGEHFVTPEEFQEVVSHPKRQETSRTSGDLLAMGWTSTGRYLCCSYRLHDHGMSVEPVNAFDVEY